MAVSFPQQVALDALQKMKGHTLSIRKILNQPVNCVITVDGASFRVSFSGLNPVSLGVMPGSIIEIRGGASNGCWIILSVAGSYVNVEGLTAQAYGQCVFYDVDFELMTDIASVAIDQAEVWTGQSFSGVEDFTEYRDGTSSTRLVLQKRRIRSITSITLYGIVPSFGVVFGISVDDIDQDFAQKTGILQITPSAASGAMQLQSNLLTSRFFPPGKIQIIGTYGWDEDDIPDDVRRAIVNLMVANVLNDEMSRGGNVNNFTIEGYSQGSELGRDVGTYKNAAFSLLSKYVSGQVGS